MPDKSAAAQRAWSSIIPKIGTVVKTDKMKMMPRPSVIFPAPAQVTPRTVIDLRSQHWMPENVA